MSKGENKGVKEKFSAAKKKKNDITKYYNDIAMKNDAINKLKDIERKNKKQKRQAPNPFGNIRGLAGFGSRPQLKK